MRHVEEARWKTGKPPITVRWVDVNKGDGLNPKVRSRLPARQVRHADEEDVFARTPPLEALRSIISLAATDLPSKTLHERDPRSGRRTRVSVINIYFGRISMLRPREPSPRT